MRKDKGFVELVKRKDTRMYLHLYTIIHDETTSSSWGKEVVQYEDKTRTRLGYNTYCMRRWLRLLRRSWSLSSYSLPMSMLSPGGIDHNKYRVLICIVSDWDFTITIVVRMYTSLLHILCHVPSGFGNMSIFWIPFPWHSAY